jgi:signal transduction histidine kinase
VLSDFARRIGGTYSAEGVLPQMAQTVAAGTGAEQVVVWLRVDDELRPEASSDGSSRAGPLPVAGHELPRLPDADMSAPVVHQGELLGAISVQMPKDEPLRPAGQQLIADVASQAGLVLSNVGLIEDLRASRQRLVTAQDEARRRLERNIHDGAQQDLVALAIKLRLADMTVEDPVQTRELLGELQADAAGALANLRDLARGIYPPLLADLGLAAALSAQASKSPLPVTVEADEIGRFGQDTEAAVYFCCLEALQNTAKYAHATQVRICLQAPNGTLRFTVSDDGTGYDARHTPMGSGLRNMADRVAALGGRLEVQSAPGQGTTVTGQLPVPSCTPAGTGS